MRTRLRTHENRLLRVLTACNGNGEIDANTCCRWTCVKSCQPLLAKTAQKAPHADHRAPSDLRLSSAETLYWSGTIQGCYARFVWSSEDQTLIMHAAHFNGQSPTAPIRADNWLKSAPRGTAHRRPANRPSAGSQGPPMKGTRSRLLASRSRLSGGSLGWAAVRNGLRIPNGIRSRRHRQTRSGAVKVPGTGTISTRLTAGGSLRQCGF